MMVKAEFKQRLLLRDADAIRQHQGAFVQGL